jgi:large subunit ribosomal protein L29
MTKARELREMPEEQIRLVWKDAAESLFRLRVQAQTEKLAAPTELRNHRRTIARCQTILAERGLLVTDHATPAAQPAAQGDHAQQGEHDPAHDKHARKRKASGRAKIRAEKTGRAPGRRQYQKRSQSGK